MKLPGGRMVLGTGLMLIPTPDRASPFPGSPEALNFRLPDPTVLASVARPISIHSHRPRATRHFRKNALDERIFSRQAWTRRAFRPGLTPTGLSRFPWVVAHR